MNRPLSFPFSIFLFISSLSLRAQGQTRIDPEHVYDHPTLAIGSSAPDFSLTCVDGQIYTLQSFKDAQVLVVVFMCNHCPTSQAYEKRIIQLTSDYTAKGLRVVAI